MRKFLSIAACLASCLVIQASAVFGQVSVLTQHNDNSRTGQNLQETTLNTSVVNVSNFGKLFSLPVDNNIFAQPLYVPSLTIGGATHNVVYVATMQNSVYAFDADSGNTTPLWKVNLGTPAPSQDICAISSNPSQCTFTDVIPVIGILPTPVIDPAAQIIYVVANTVDSIGHHHFSLHALNLITGAEMFAGPTEITANGFDPLVQLCRPGLLLANGNIYFAFGSVGDITTWHGWVMAYNATTLQQVAVYNSTPQNNDVGGAGIWQTGNGLVADSSGNIYAITSNGNFDVNVGGEDYGSAYLKLNGSTLSVMDYFVPYNQSSLNPETFNVDLGSGGALLIPNTTVLMGGGKDAVLRLLDTANMGKFNPVQNNNLQNILGATNKPIFGSPVYWDSPTLGPLLYMWGQGDYVKAWGFNTQTSQLSTTPTMESAFKATSGWNDQSALSISANGTTAGTGILWASMPYSGISNPGPVPGIMYAIDASTLIELWDSQMNAARDSVGDYAKFNPPTIANGKVYLATFVTPGQSSGQLLVYGLIPHPDFALSTTPGSETTSPGNPATYTVTVSPVNGFNSAVSFTFAGCPPGATCSFNPAIVSNGSGASTLTVTTSTSTPTGSYNVTVTGSGSSASHSTTVSLTVGGPNFALNVSPASVSLNAGSSVLSTVTLTPQNGFAAAVTLACSGLPTGSNCSFSPQTVPLSGAPATSMLTISTAAANASLTSPSRGIFFATLLPIGGFVLFGAGFASRRKRLLGITLVFLLFSVLILMPACNSSSSSGGGGGGTPVGSYTIKVTGTGPSGSPVTSQTITLSVQ